MKIISINSVPYGSTAKIMFGITEVARNCSINIDTCAGYSSHPLKERPKNHMQIGSIYGKAVHMYLARVTGLNGCFSRHATHKLLSHISENHYDTIHLHNLHGWYINLPMLFSYINVHNLRVIWTFHDCWPFTGQCPHFIMVKCDKWKTGCYDCPQYRDYPESFVDCTEKMYKLKRDWFTLNKHLTIVTPSKWLGKLVKESFLNQYPVEIINNGIDLSVFKPTINNIKVKYNLKDKYILLGVAFGWSKRKGLDVFIELSKKFDEKYKIILVGIDATTNMQLPHNIIPIYRTQNQTELAELYTAADVFVNPTREEVFGLVNLEALACGTPVITFNTGGCPECIDETCGIVVPCDCVNALYQAIEKVCINRPFTSEACMNRAKEFDMKNKFLEYVNLYRRSESI